MVAALVASITQQADAVAGWKTLVKPTDRVGIKVATSGGRYFSTHRGVVAAIVDGLIAAGVPRTQIVIWDRQSTDLRTAGFTPASMGVQVLGIDPPRGFDRDAKFTTAVLGKLIWGDLLFEEKKPKAGKRANDSDDLSSISHLATILSRGITKIVNVPVLCDEVGCGISGALYNVTVPAVDNWRRFTQPGGTGGIAELYADDRIGPHVVLHILDGLMAQYAGGPGPNPNYSFKHATLYASRDPVALDATALRLIDGWRVEAKLPRIGKRAEWLEDAAQMGLGQFDEARIELHTMPPAP